MLSIITLKNSYEWDLIVRSFHTYDVYYLSGYVKAFKIHGDGEPELFYYKTDGLRAIYVYMKRETNVQGIYDSITPYGYGGFIIEGDNRRDVTALNNLWNAYCSLMKETNIVDNFVRFHPVINNAPLLESCSSIINLGRTISIDLSSKELIWSNLHSKNRNMIRKAEKNGVIIHHGRGMQLMDEFIKMYNNTMQYDNASSYYFFERDFYESINNDLSDNHMIFWAEYKGQKIAMCILLFANGFLNYHLSGSDIQYRNLAPTNLMLYKASLWGQENGMHSFHLGGGLGSNEDSLFKFKASFNRFSSLQFSIAKQIFDNDSYDFLIKDREERDESFNRSCSFFPAYRAN